jgi:ABC-type transport system substrate-binding protein
VNRIAIALMLVLSAAGVARAQDGKPYAPPEFPKELPFDAKEWQTNDKYPAIGDPRAKRVSKDPLLVRWETFPVTLRTEGPNSNIVETATIQALLYESLVQLHPETEEYTPMLASYWKIETDEKKGNQTFTFRINPKARWADGTEVTTDDVAASFWHRVQKDRDDPSNEMTFNEGFETPKILDKLTIQVTTKELNWRLFQYFSGMAIYQAKEVRIPGKQYLEDYNWKFLTGSGPYEMKPEGLKKGESLTVTRRSDWWAENENWAKNTYNFAAVKGVVVLDEEAHLQMFKKGELDHFRAQRAQQWVEIFPKEEIIKQGWVKMRKVYDQAPRGFSGLAFNMREKPLDDKRVRLALSHLFNRERLMEKLFFNEYEFLNSYEPGRDWGNEDENEIVVYDPVKAGKLLAAAGFNKRDADGFLLDAGGNRLEFTLELDSPTLERIFLIVKEDFEKAGVKLELKKLDYSTVVKKVGQRQFKIHYQSWGGLAFPNPETSWHSKLADKLENNNITSFHNARVDELCKKYNVTFDLAEQKKICREIDKIVYEEHPYALGWYAPYNRVLFWDKFGHPDSYFTRTSRQADFVYDMMLTWWFDPDRIKTLEEAKASGKPLEQGEVNVKPWEKK